MVNQVRAASDIAEICMVLLAGRGLTSRIAYILVNCVCVMVCVLSWCTTSSFQASCEQDRQEWLDKLTTAILTGLDSRQSTLSTGKLARTKSSVSERSTVQVLHSMCMVLDLQSRVEPGHG